MSQSNTLPRQGQHLLQIGVGLLLYSSLDGFVIPYLGSPRIGLSVHTLSGLQAVLFLALGIVWPRLVLGTAAARTAFWLLWHFVAKSPSECRRRLASQPWVDEEEHDLP
jgi:(hydroxyamino)benzene mutase